MNKRGPTATEIPAAQLLHHVQGHDPYALPDGGAADRSDVRE